MIRVGAHGPAHFGRLYDPDAVAPRLRAEPARRPRAEGLEREYGLRLGTRVPPGNTSATTIFPFTWMSPGVQLAGPNLTPYTFQCGHRRTRQGRTRPRGAKQAVACVARLPGLSATHLADQLRQPRRQPWSVGLAAVAVGRLQHHRRRHADLVDASAQARRKRSRVSACGLPLRRQALLFGQFRRPTLRGSTPPTR